MSAVAVRVMTCKPPLPLQLAARIAVSNLHKSTKKSFSQTCVAPAPCSLLSASPHNAARGLI
jgi:hypothetical protein